MTENQNQPYQYQPQQYNPVPPQPQPQKPSRFKRFALPVGLLLLGLIVGGASGASAVPEPVVQTVEKEKVVEKKVEVTPASCTVALDTAEQFMQSSGRVVDVFVDILGAVQELDAAKISALNPKIDVETEVIKGLTPKYKSAASACRAG